MTSSSIPILKSLNYMLATYGQIFDQTKINFLVKLANILPEANPAFETEDGSTLDLLWIFDQPDNLKKFAIVIDETNGISYIGTDVEFMYFDADQHEEALIAIAEVTKLIKL